jgi:hypothetical protein
MSTATVDAGRHVASAAARQPTLERPRHLMIPDLTQCLDRVNMSRHGSAMASPVYLQQRTYLVTAGMAVECQQRAHARTTLSLFDHLISAAKQSKRKRKAGCFCSLEF